MQPFILLFLLLFLKKGRLPLYQVVESFRPAMARAYKLAQVNHGIQTVLVLFQPTIYRFLVPKLTLDGPECVLYFTTHRRFAVFHVAFPVDSVVANLGKTIRTAVDAEVNVGKMLVVCDFRTLLDTNIARISIYYLVIFPEQICCLRDVMFICRCGTRKVFLSSI